MKPEPCPVTIPHERHCIHEGSSFWHGLSENEICASPSGRGTEKVIPCPVVEAQERREEMVEAVLVALERYHGSKPKEG